MNLPPLILASASPRRAQLLRQIGLDFRIAEAGVTEAMVDFLTSGEMAQFNAHRKARAVAEKHPEALVLGADTIVCLEDVPFGKPKNLAEAHQMLEKLQGRAHQVITGVCLIHRAAKRQKLFAETTHVRFRTLTEAQIARYLASMNPLDKAGAYAIQEQGDWLVEQIRGSYSNVVGLPLKQLEAELRGWGG